MKVTRWVEVESEVEISISLDDIANAITDDFDENKQGMFCAINNFSAFMGKIPDDSIAECNDREKGIIVDFLKAQLARFDDA